MSLIWGFHDFFYVNLNKQIFEETFEIPVILKTTGLTCHHCNSACFNLFIQNISRTRSNGVVRVTDIFCGLVSISDMDNHVYHTASIEIEGC